MLGISMSKDLAVLDYQIALELVSGNQNLADELLAMLIKLLPDYQQEIEKLQKNNDRPALKIIIHKIHGGLAYLGTPALLEIISDTDQNLFEFNDEQLDNNIKQIIIEFSRVLKQGKYSKFNL